MSAIFSFTKGPNEAVTCKLEDMTGVNSDGKNSFCYTGAKLWNSLPGELKSITTLPHFKQCVKLHLLNKVRQQEVSDFTYF